MTTPQTIVIIGGGFGGVYTARHLRRLLPRTWDIILFSQENHFIFTPLLGDVVGSSINPMHVVWPIRAMAPGVTCRTAALTGIDLANRQVSYRTLAGREATQGYQHLVLACGSMVNLDIIPGMAAHGWPVKTMGDALMLRNHLIGQLERAEVETDPEVRRRLLSVVVVGGGFSGVEVAGEVIDLLHESARFYSALRREDIRVTLLEGRDRILAELPESLATFATKKMQQNGVLIRTQAVAQSVTGEGVRLKDGSAIDAGTIICTIGTAPNPLLTGLGLPLQWNRLKTGPDLRVEGREELWAVGDCALVPNARDGKFCAPTAQFAVRQAKVLAQNLAQSLAGKPTRPFSFKPQGMLAAIGNRKAVGLVFGIKVSGFLAWFLWRGVYLGKMPSLARKVQIAFDWAWQLIFPRDIAQLSLGQTERLARAHFEAGQYIFHKGDPGDRFYLIQRGKAGVYLDEADAPVAVLGVGDHFGEGALLQSGIRSASVKAEEPLDVLLIGRPTFQDMTGHLQLFRSALERSWQAARSSVQLLELARDNPRLNTIPVREVMSQPVTTLPVALTFAEALKASQERGKGAYPVVDGAGRMVGLVTRTDFYNALQRLKPPHTPLSAIMKHPVLSVRETDTLTEALLKFVRNPIKRLVVVASEDDTQPVGMVTPFDILKILDVAELTATAAER